MNTTDSGGLDDFNIVSPKKDLLGGLTFPEHLHNFKKKILFFKKGSEISHFSFDDVSPAKELCHLQP